MQWPQEWVTEQYVKNLAAAADLFVRVIENAARVSSIHVKLHKELKDAWDRNLE